MAFTITEIFGRSFRIGADFQRNYARKFRVLTDDPQIDGFQVYLALGLPIGAHYQSALRSDLFAWVKSVSVDEEASGQDGIEWIVSVDYGPWEPQNEDPRLNPPEVGITFVEFEEVVTEDVESGDPVANSAGDPYADPPVMRDNTRAIITVRRNEPNYSISLASNYRNVVNAGAFTIGDLTFPPKTILCKPITADRAFHSNAGFYWPTTYVFHLELQHTWRRELLDRGFRRYHVDGNKLIVGPDNHPVTEPALLDGSGQPLDPGAPPVVRTFDVYESRDFSVFNGLF